MARILAETVDEVTFLGAHTVPPEHSADEYVDLVCGPMLDAVREYVSWIDVFCEKGAFDAEQSLQVLRTGKRAGLGMRLHAAQLNPSSIIADAVELGVASIDHCTFLSDMDVSAIADSHTVATVLPAAEFSTRQPYPDASRLLRAGATVALATDCNPGTAFTSSMPFCLAVAVREMSMTPEQALWSATAGGAAALRRGDVGVVRPHPAGCTCSTAPGYHSSAKCGGEVCAIRWGRSRSRSESLGAGGGTLLQRPVIDMIGCRGFHHLIPSGSAAQCPIGMPIHRTLLSLLPLLLTFLSPRCQWSHHGDPPLLHVTFLSPAQPPPHHSDQPQRSLTFSTATPVPRPHQAPARDDFCHHAAGGRTTVLPTSPTRHFCHLTTGGRTAGVLSPLT